ncbi:MAG: SH3 domain-containing protein [Pseudomonadota bacterium]|nr:SH3 domain-containing protein [Pseudomonadota bacterium]
MPSSGSPPSPIVDGFALSGVSALPDPATNAYRKDLADVSLAGRVIASHYAAPLLRHIVADTPLRADSSIDSDVVGSLRAGEEFGMLDNSLGWAWGYAAHGRVGYVPSAAVGA